MADAYYEFSHLNNLNRALKARNRRLAEDIKALQATAKSEAAAIAEEYREQEARCIQILRHNGREIVRADMIRFQLRGTVPYAIDIVDMSNYQDVHDLRMPDDLQPADAA